MALKSSRFAANLRLQAAAVNNPAIGAFEPNREAVALIQQALRDLHDPQIGLLPLSFGKGAPDGIYGGETVGAVRQFQRKQGLNGDGVCGKNTLNILDSLYLASPPGKSPPPNIVDKTPPSEAEVEQYLISRQKRNVVDVMLDLTPNLVVFGEFHVGEAHKSYLIHRMIMTLAKRQPNQLYFHASEYLHQEHWDRLEKFLHASPIQSQKNLFSLPPTLLKFLPIISAAADFPHRHAAIIPAGSHVSGSDKGGADVRHRTLFESFNQSVNRYNQTHKGHIDSLNNRGNFLIGAFHAARRHIYGRAAKTTTQLLIDAGWRVHVVRVVVDIRVLFPADSINLAPFSNQNGKSFDLIPMLTRLSAGKPFHVPITGSGSPFARLKLEGAADQPYNELFDSLLYLPLTIGY